MGYRARRRLHQEPLDRRANLAGLNAARLARAGLAHNLGAAAHSLGGLMGTLDPGALVDDLGERWPATEGYQEMHSSCSYTHPAVDIVQALHRVRPWRPDDIGRVAVRTNSLATPLLNRHPKNRLAAMFSLPFVVSTAVVVSGRVDPQTMDPAGQAFRAAEALSERVDVTIDETLDSYLPDRRCTEVTIEFTDVQTLGLCQPNLIGDADHFPLSAEQTMAKLTALIGPADADRIRTVISALATAPDTAMLLDQLP